MIMIPARPGAGGPGGAGGTVVVSYVQATQPPIVSAPGGNGGPRGSADRGAEGSDLLTMPIAVGRPSACGPNGSATAQVVSGIDQVWDAIPTNQIARNWAAFRSEVALYNFRCFDPPSLITAIQELQAAMQLDPANTATPLLLKRLVNGQTPSGQCRDVDIAPDYKDLASGLPAEINNVQTAFNEAQVSTITADICANTKVQLELEIERAKADQTYAQSDMQISEAGADFYASRVAEIQNQLSALADQQFSIIQIVETVGAVAAAIGSIASGVAAIISIPASLVAIGDVAETSDSMITLLQQKEMGKDLRDLGQGLEGLTKVGQGVINIATVITQIEAASSQDGQGEAGDLLRQLAEATWEQIVATFRASQAQDYINALQQTISGYNIAIRDLDSLITGDLFSGTLQLLAQARALANQVSDQMFLADRALEIYELDTPVVRFDYGYIPPDEEHDYCDDSNSHDLAVAALSSFGRLPQDEQTWSSIYKWTDVAQGSFDVVHPNWPVTIIADDAIRNALKPGNALRFSVDIRDLPLDIYEVKVNGLLVDLVGATADESVMLWVEHSGQWSMRRRDNGDVEKFYLLPRREICNLTANASGLSGKIPEMSQSSAEPGPPFSFWGRGVAADWILNLEPETRGSAHFDVTNLSKVVVTFMGLAFAPRLPATPLQMPLLKVVARPIIHFADLLSLRCPIA